jgi:hypothetical protein
LREELKAMHEGEQLRNMAAAQVSAALLEEIRMLRADLVSVKRGGSYLVASDAVVPQQRVGNDQPPLSGPGGMLV